MKDLKLFGMRIKDLRIIRKLPQEQLANALNVDFKDFFEFTHEGKNTKELRRIISELLKDADEERLRLVVKILRGVLR